MQKQTFKKFFVWIAVAGFVSITSCQPISLLFNESRANTGVVSQETAQPKVYSSPLPNFEPIQLAWFYKPPENTGDLSFISSHFNFYILTRNDEPEREKISNDRNGAEVLQYLRFEAIMDPGDKQTKPHQNQVANLEGDFYNINNQHRDWFLSDEKEVPIKFEENGYLMMDPGNQGWQAFFLDKISGFQKDPGWDGVFLDNVDASLGRFKAQNKNITRYLDDRSFQDAVILQLAGLNDYFQKDQRKILFANITYLKQTDVWFEYLSYLDGAMMEAFAVDWNTGYLPESEWLNHLDIAESTQVKGKTIILVTQGNYEDHNRMLFGLASFLLVNNGQAYFRYTNDENYRNVWWYPEFDLELGQPIGPRYSSSGIWRRDFENGSIMVDPINHVAEINLN